MEKFTNRNGKITVEKERERERVKKVKKEKKEKKSKRSYQSKKET